jgi:hypothetical protein
MQYKKGRKNVVAEVTSPLEWTRTPFNGVGKIYIYCTVAASLEIFAEKNYKMRFLKGQYSTEWSISEEVNAIIDASLRRTDNSVRKKRSVVQ